MREVIKTAPTVEQAIEEAIARLGVTRNEVTVDVLEYPEKKFFFKKPAKVKVTLTEEEELSLDEIFAPADEKPETEAKKAPEAKKTAEVRKERPEKKPAPTRAEKTPEETRLVPAQTEKTEKARRFLKSVLRGFDMSDCTVESFRRDSGYVIKIDGEHMGALIGRKGETMEALSYLTGLVANRGDGEFEKITVDVAGYRKKRERDIEQSARRAALRVRKTGRPFTFEPMNPYERRIVHSAASKVEGVKSESRGEGSRRRVVIYSVDGGKSGYDRPRRKGSYDRDKNRGRDRRPQVQKTREEKLVDEGDIGLYSKIDI